MGARDQSEAGIQPAQRTEAAFVIERQQSCWIWREFLSRNDTKTTTINDRCGRGGPRILLDSFQIWKLKKNALHFIPNTTDQIYSNDSLTVSY